MIIVRVDVRINKEVYDIGVCGATYPNCTVNTDLVAKIASESKA